MLIDITGQRFGRLAVMRLHLLASRQPRRNTSWVCICDCGRTVIVTGCNLTSGNSRSCGCLHHDAVTKHGQYLTREYAAWGRLIQRCLNPKDARYKNYGGRGIIVCERWLHSFENFLADMGPRPSGHSIERINNDGNYEPSNCKWLPLNEQAKNRSQPTRKLTKKQRLEIRVASAAGASQRVLAQQFSVSRALIRSIVA